MYEEQKTYEEQSQNQKEEQYIIPYIHTNLVKTHAQEVQTLVDVTIQLRGQRT